jgi:hypothetical protein
VLALEQAFGSPEPIRSVPSLHLAQGRLGDGDELIEANQLTSLGHLLAGHLGLGALGVLEAPAERFELTTRKVQTQRPQLGNKPVVASGGLGLALKGTELAAHLSLQVLQAEEVLLA